MPTTNTALVDLAPFPRPSLSHALSGIGSMISSGQASIRFDCGNVRSRTFGRSTRQSRSSRSLPIPEIVRDAVVWIGLRLTAMARSVSETRFCTQGVRDGNDAPAIERTYRAHLFWLIQHGTHGRHGMLDTDGDITDVRAALANAIVDPWFDETIDGQRLT